jgi:hypothetical protein
MINVNIDFIDKQKFANLIRYIDNLGMVEFESEIMDVADASVKDVQDYIGQSKKRPDKGTHNLENSIEATPLNTPAAGQEEIGIGEIQKMTTEAPYWELIDRGGMISEHRVPTGGFTPGEPKSNQANFREASDWSKGNGNYSFIAKGVIEGMDYVGHLYSFLEKKIDETITKLGGKVIDRMGR